MGVPIPHYLKDIAVLEKQKDTWVHFSVKCSCGSDRFLVYENYLNKEETALEKPYYDKLTEIYCSNSPRITTKDENGKIIELPVDMFIGSIQDGDVVIRNNEGFYEDGGTGKASRGNY